MGQILINTAGDSILHLPCIVHHTVLAALGNIRGLLQASAHLTTQTDVGHSLAESSRQNSYVAQIGICTHPLLEGSKVLCRKVSYVSDSLVLVQIIDYGDAHEHTIGTIGLIAFLNIGSYQRVVPQVALCHEHECTPDCLPH